MELGTCYHLENASTPNFEISMLLQSHPPVAVPKRSMTSLESPPGEVRLESVYY